MSHRTSRLQRTLIGRIVRVLLAAGLFTVMVLAPLTSLAQTNPESTLEEFDPEATGAGLFPRIVFNGQALAGWDFGPIPSDRSEYVGFEGRTPYDTSGKGGWIDRHAQLVARWRDDPAVG